VSAPESPDKKTARALECSVEEVQKARSTWNNNRIMRYVLRARLDSQIEERRTQLETCAPEKLPKLQGDIAGIRLAIATITQEEK